MGTLRGYQLLWMSFVTPTGADKDSLMHERGNRTGTAIIKNRLYLRKKSFFERFFAHKTGRDKKKYINDTCKLDN